MLDLGTARGAITLDAAGFLSGVAIVRSGVEELGSIGGSIGRELNTLSGEIDGVTHSVIDLGNIGGTAGRGLGDLGEEARATTTQLSDLGNQVDGSTSSIEDLGNSGTTAAAGLGDLDQQIDAALASVDELGQSGEEAGQGLENLGDQADVAKAGIDDVRKAGDDAESSLGALDSQVEELGSSMEGLSGASRIFDNIAKSLGAIAIVGGITLIAGGAKAAWDQVRSVQNATSALRAYEKDATKVDAVLKGLLEYARSDLGVLFSRQELFSAAQGLRLYGAETNNLVRYVEIMSRSVGLGLSNWDQLGTVIGRVGSTGKLVGQDFDYLTAAGFRLDEGLRNANLSWDELFAALDAGIPEDALDGIAANIDGLVIRMQSARRDIGNAFLGVDRETSQFIEGGLGARLTEWLRDSPGLIRNFTDAAGTIGSTLSAGLGVVDSFIAAYQSVPNVLKSVVEWILKLVTAYGALRVASAALGLIGSLTGVGGLIGNIRNLTGGFAAASGGTTSLASSLAMLVGRINPVGLAITAVVAVGGYLIKSFGDQRRAAEEYERSLSSLDDTLEMLRRRGSTALADLATAFKDLLNAGIQSQMNEFLEAFNPANLDIMDDQEIVDLWRAITGEEWRGDMVGAREDITAHWAAISAEMKIAQTDITALNDLLNEALNDPNINVEAWMEWATSLLTGAENADELRAAVDQVLSTPLSDFAKDSADAMDELGHSAEKVVATFEEVSTVFSGLPRMVDDLRIKGLDQAADDILRLGEAMESVFSPKYEYQLDSSGADTGVFSLIDGLDPEKLMSVSESFNRISDAISSGDFDNARLLADVFAILDDTGLTMDQKADEIDRIANSLSGYVDVAKVAAESMQRLIEVAGYDDPLSRWNLTGNASDMSMLAMSTTRAAAALDDTFRVIVGNTNAIASQADSVHQWAQALTTAEEGLTKIDELLASNLITQTEYNNAMQAVADIAAANETIQSSVLAIQAKQAPLVAQQTEALAGYMEQISKLPAQQQLVALGWMDAATAAQAMEFQTLAVAAATGQLGDAGQDMFASMIGGAVMAQPELAAVLEDMGLISMGTDGTITIHWSGLQEGMSDFDRLSVMFLEFMNLVSNEPVTFEMLGLDDPRHKLEDIEDTTHRLDGSVVTIGAEIDEGSEGGLSGQFDSLITGIQNNLPRILVPVELQLPSSAASGVGHSAGQAAAGALKGVAADLVITVSADTSIADERLSSINNALADLGSVEPTVTIVAETAQADAALDTLQVRLFGFDGLISTTTLDADASAANATLDDLAARLSGYRGLTSVTTLDADGKSANNELDDLAQRLTGYRNLTSTTTLDADPKPADSVLDTLGTRLSGYRGLVSRTTLAATDNASSVIDGVESKLSNLDGSSARVYIYVTDWATAAINSVSRALSNLDGRSATTYTTQVSTSVNRQVSQSQPMAMSSGIGDSVPMTMGLFESMLADAMPLVDSPGMSIMTSSPMSQSAPPPPPAASQAGFTTVINNYYDDHSDRSTNTTASAEELSMIARRANRANSYVDARMRGKPRGGYERTGA